MSTLQSVNDITAFFQKELPKRIAFHQHPLKQETDYLKEVYLTMLAVILQCEHTPETEQITFFKRLIEGIESEISAEQYMRQALVVTEQLPQDFYNELYKNKLFKNFIIDALVMINCKKKMNTQQLLFLADLLNIFQISEAQLCEWSMFAKNILIQNKEAILKYVTDYADFENLKLFAYYNLDSNYDYYLDNGDVQQIEHLMNSESDCVFFENCNFTKNLLTYTIHSKKIVHFKNCHFEGISIPLQYLNLHALIFEECHFKNFEHAVMLIDNVEHIFVTKCSIENLKISTQDTAAFINVYENSGNIMMVNCDFENIIYENDGVLFTENLIGLLPKNINIHLQDNVFRKIPTMKVFSLFSKYDEKFLFNIKSSLSNNINTHKLQVDIKYNLNFDRKEFVGKATLDAYIKKHLNLGGNQNIQIDNEVIDDNDNRNNDIKIMRRG